MKKNITLLILLVFGFAKAQQSYDSYFTKEALRIDLYLYGDKKTTQANIKRLKREPVFGGSHLHLIHPNQGNYRVQLKDAKTKELIFSKGFNSLFEEWQTTEDAMENSRMFETPVQVPFPKLPVILEFTHRDYNGVFQKIFETKIDPTDYHIIKDLPTSYPVKTILENGTPDKKIDLVMVAEGYTKEQMPKFIADVKRHVNYLFSIPPFDKHKKDFNIYAIETPSVDSGTDLNGENIFKNTMFDTHFYTFNTPRYLTCPSLFKVADVAGLLPYDQIYIMVNTEHYGGGAFYNLVNLGVADHSLAEKVFVHEFGHGLVGLADEYYYDDGMGEGYNLKIEPWEPNITTLVDFQSKWKDMVEKRTPIPTPRTEKYKDKVGVFEGGGYLSKGMYSPVEDCRMKSNEPKGFCPVCTRAIEKIINFYTE